MTNQLNFGLKSVLLLDNIDTECGRLLEEANIRTKTVPKLTKDELITELKKHDAVVVRSATKLTADVLEQCSHLKLIGRAGTGVDNINVDAATENGILVMNTPGGNTISAAEQTCALICSLSRKIPQACASLKLGAWDRKKYMGNELYGKTLAIIGLGRIGREVSTRMKSFGMNVIGYDPIVSKKQAEEWGIQFYQLEDIWPKADYITVHTPLLPQTRNLIGEHSFGRCKPTVKIVNVARGGIVDERALLKALEAGICAGAALDVFEEEPPKNSDLLTNPNVICTPHLGANTYEAQRRVAVEIAQQFIELSEGLCYTGLVNFPALAQITEGNSSQWIILATYLGNLCEQLRGACKKPATVEISLGGEETMKLSDILKCAVMRGILSPTISWDETRKEEPYVKLNLVNAAAVASRNGMVVTIKNDTNADVKDGIHLRMSGNGKMHSVKGTVVDGMMALCEIEGSVFDPEFILSQRNSGQTDLIFLKAESNDRNNLMTNVAGLVSALICLVMSTDSKWYVIKTKKYVNINDKVSARLNSGIW